MSTTVVQYRGAGGSVPEIAGTTDPWLQHPDGTVVNLAEHPRFRSIPTSECDCTGGWFAPTGNGPTEHGIERHDECEVFDGDLTAALALAQHLDPTGNLTVWYETDEDVTR